MTTQQFLLSTWHCQPLALAVGAVAVVGYAAVVRKAEGRNPKAEGRPKSEGRRAGTESSGATAQEVGRSVPERRDGWNGPNAGSLTAADGGPGRTAPPEQLRLSQAQAARKGASNAALRISGFDLPSAFGFRASAFFLLALTIFLLTLVSPLDTLADGYLFSAHMLQHLLLLLVVPPLALLAWPKASSSALRAPHSALRTLLCWLSGVGAMWFWHAPTLCNAATASPVVRGVQTVSLLLLGTLFWLPILAPTAGHRLSPLAGVLYLFTACVGCTLLGILITFAPVSVCSIYMHPVDRLGILPLIRQNWGLTPSVDQQVGGLLMWVPACLIYLCAILSLLAHWFSAADTESQAGPATASEQPHPGGAGFQSA